MPLIRIGVVLAVGVAVSCGRQQPENTTSAQPAPRAWNLTVTPESLPAPANSGEPQLTASAKSVILSWLEHDGKVATLRFSERTSGGWTAPRTVASSDNWFVSWADVPSVLRMSDGTLVATWNPATDPAIEAYDLRLSYSKDDGKTWAPALAPHHDGTRTQHGFASLFELPGPALGLVWLDGREQVLHEGDPDGASMTLYFASFDGSWRQTAETAVNARVCECCPTAAAVTDEGPISAFRDRSATEVRDIQVSRFADGRWTEAAPLHTDDWKIEACPVNGPMLSARGRSVAAAWLTAAGGSPHAFAAFSNDAGRTWGKPVRLDDQTALGYVDVELLDDGSAVASWVEFANEQRRFRVRRVEPSGARSPAMEVTPERVIGYPRLARRGGELVFVWTERADSDADGEQIKGAIAHLP